MSTEMEEIGVEDCIRDLSRHLDDFCRMTKCLECKLYTTNNNCLKRKVQKQLDKIIKKLNEGEKNE